ncbi:phage tail-collar fiber domain-containing protein [Clostridium saccharoperbutylacetonicum]
MTESFYTILTKIGKAKIANSAGFGTKLNITNYKIGDGGGQYYEPTEQQTDLIHAVYEGKVNDIKIDKENPNWICFELVLPANIGGFFIREYGIFDDEGDMIAVAKCPESYKPLQTDGAAKEMSLELILAVLNVDSVKLQIDKTLIFVTKSEFDQINDEIFPNSEVITINHGLDNYPNVRIIATNYGAGIGGAGKTPAGGTESYSVQSKVCFLDRDNIRIYIPKKYFLSSGKLEKINSNRYIITFDNSIMSLLIDLIYV